jgi:hypothetical protein
VNVPSGFRTRAADAITSKGRGAKITPKFEIAESNDASGTSSSTSASPTWNVTLVSCSAWAERSAAASIGAARSTPSTRPPGPTRFAAGKVAVPGPQPMSINAESHAGSAISTSRSATGTSSMVVCFW